MDFLKKGEAMLKGNSGSSSQQPAAGATDPNAQAASGAQTQDYGDKGLAFLEKKTGHNMDAATNEKITDGLRNAYEKGTGNTVDPKYSN